MTGATGWVGKVVVDELLGNHHAVVALARSEERAAALGAKGATVVRGTLDDVELLSDASGRADAVIHLAFNHDFSKMAESSEQERRAIDAMGAALRGTEKPLLVSAGMAFLATGRVATEADMPGAPHPHFPRTNQVTAAKLAADGVRVSIVRLATTVHGVGETVAFLPLLAKLAREKGVSAYLDDGANRWPAVHVSDAGRLYRQILESGTTARAYHATAEDVPFKAVATAIGHALGVPVASRPREHFGWFAGFAAADSPTSSARTRELTGRQPTGPTLLEDLANPAYFAV